MTTGDVASSEDDIWADDMLARKDDALFLQRFLEARVGELQERGEARSYVLNLDAPWGSGKSFFLDRFRQQLEASGHLVILVDAWRNDFADDPLIVVMAEIDAEVSRRSKPQSRTRKALKTARAAGAKVAVEVGKGIARRALSFAITEAATVAVENILSAESAAAAAPTIHDAAQDGATAAVSGVEKHNVKAGADAISAHRNTVAMIDGFRNKLETLIEATRGDGFPSPVYIFIDELDRCRPPFAIAMLERIKHIFNVPGTVFVVATATGQLNHAIGAVYGQNFDGAGYLTRFFDRTYLFGRPDTQKFVDYLVKTRPLAMTKLSPPFKMKIARFIAEYFRRLELEPRAMAAAYDHLRTIVSVWTYSFPIELTIMVPLIVSYQTAPSDFRSPGKNGFGSGDVALNSDWDVIHRTGQGPVNVSVPEMAKALWSAAHQELARLEFSSTAMRNPVSAWVSERLYAERVALQGSGPPLRTTSAIADYPAIVAQSGRLVAQEGGEG